MTDCKSILDLDDTIYSLRQVSALLALVHTAFAEGPNVILDSEMSDALYCILRLLRENVLGLEVGLKQLAERQKGVAKA